MGTERAAAALLDNLDHPNVDARLLYLQALRRLPLPQNAPEILQAAMEDTRVGRYREFAQQLQILRALKNTP